MKILITGAAGFIGSNLTKALLNEGHNVIGFDNFSQGDRLNIAEFQKNPKFSLIEGDVLDLNSFKKAASGCQVIYHLAAFKIPRYDNAYHTIHINTHGTENAIEATAEGKAHLIFASTSDVYGKNPHTPFSEEHDLVLGPPTVKRWSYAMSKALDEQLIFAEADRRKIKFTIVRFFGGYGPNQNLTWWGGPQSVFINQALDNQALTIHGDGKQTRSFTFIDDHVTGLSKILKSPASVGQVLNLGNDREISILDLAKMIWTLVRPNESPKIEMVPYQSFGKYEDVIRRVPDLTKMKKILEFTPQWSLEKGLPPTIEWQKLRRTQLAGKS